MAVLPLPRLPLCGPPEGTFGWAHLASGYRVRDAQSIFGCLWDARSGFFYLYCMILAWPVLL